jgi:hypothetical protein
MATVLLAAIGLFISGLLPPAAAALIIGCWVAAEFLIALDAFLEMRRPRAEVHALPVRHGERLRSRGS